MASAQKIDFREKGGSHLKFDGICGIITMYKENAEDAVRNAEKLSVSPYLPVLDSFENVKITR